MQELIKRIFYDKDFLVLNHCDSFRHQICPLAHGGINEPEVDFSDRIFTENNCVIVSRGQEILKIVIQIVIL